MSITLGPGLRLVRPGVYMHWCPGCCRAHMFNTSSTDHPKGAKWDYNGDFHKPTFSPSMKISWGPYVDDDCPSDNEPPGCCHYFLTNGQLQFLGDCTHAMAGQTVPLPDFPMERPL